MEVLPEGWHFLPKHIGKNIKFYKSILIQEKSTRVENIMNKKRDPSVVLYHKFIITSFTNCQDWGHSSILKQLTITKAQNSIIVIMTIWTPLRKYSSSRIKTLTTHGS